MSPRREDYGIDAPYVVRILGGGGLLLLLASAATTALMRLGRLGPSDLATVLQRNGFILGGTWSLFAFWMFASSRWLKQRVARALLDARAWRGDERVLDVGCGRGLVAIAAARRVPRGRVTGIDLWQAVDLSGNRPEAIRANADAASVADRLDVDTGDARSLPYPDATFDVVTSMTAIHNIPGAKGRATAIAEAWRVTKPGGQLLIFDIRHARTYAAQLRAAGARVRLTGPVLLWGPIGWRFVADKPA